MKHLLPIALGASVLACSPAPPPPAVSTLRADERVVFFTTDARRTADGGAWTVPIHAWVHEMEDTKTRKAVFAKVLEDKYGLVATPETALNFDRRVRLFVVDNERGKRVVVRIAGRSFELPPTGANGHARTEIQLDAQLVAEAAAEGGLTVTAVLPEKDARVFTGRVNLVEPQGVSVLSDIDDTVKVTEVGDKTAMFDRTFFRDFEPAPGMPELYARWAADGATFHYVSSSPWHLYEPLDEFLTASDFPHRSLSLKLVRLKDETLFDLFKEGTETKPAQIEPILARFPNRRFVLVGDSGEQDPEVYGALLRKHPGQIERVYIRNVDGSSPDDARYQAAFASIEPDRWSLFTDPAGLSLPE